MVNNFKFFSKVVLIGHDGHKISIGQTFYSVTKQRITGFLMSTPKYHIKELVMTEEMLETFIPDHAYYWYFGSITNAEWLINIWKKQDREDGI